VGIMDSSITSEALPKTSGSNKLSSSDARTAKRFVETNFLDFLSFGSGDNDEDDRFLFEALGVLGDVRPDF